MALCPEVTAAMSLCAKSLCAVAFMLGVARPPVVYPSNPQTHFNCHSNVTVVAKRHFQTWNLNCADLEHAQIERAEVERANKCHTLHT